MIVGNVIGGNPVTPRTFMLEMEDGSKIAGVLTESDTEITADANDIRQGKTALLDSGLIVGKKVIPAYHTNGGAVAIPNGSTYKIKTLKILDLYDFTKMLAIVCDFNTNLSNSVAARTVVINRNVYAVLSTISLSEVMVNHEEKTIDLGIKNETGKPQILRFITYKEIE